MKYLFAITLLLFCELYSQPVELKLNFNDGTKNIELKCGLHPDATDNFDRVLGEEFMPPFPPGDIFDIRFRILDSISGIYETSLVDFRKGDNTTNAEITYPIYLQTMSDHLTANCIIPEVTIVYIRTENLGLVIDKQLLSNVDNSISFSKENNILKLIVKFSGTTECKNEFQKIGSNELSIYPNPSNSSPRVYISIKESDEIKLTLFNSLGENLKTLYSGFLTKGIHEFSLDSSRFASGIYFITMNSSNKRISKKIVLLK